MNFGAEQATVTYNPAHIDTADIEAAVSAAGYGAEVVAEENFATEQEAIAFIGAGNTILIYGSLIELIMASRIRNPLAWSVGVLFVCMAVPPTILTLLQLQPKTVPPSVTLWAILGLPFATGENFMVLSFTLLGIVVQWMILGGLLWQCDRVLRQLRQPL